MPGSTNKVADAASRYPSPAYEEDIARNLYSDDDKLEECLQLFLAR